MRAAAVMEMRIGTATAAEPRMITPIKYNQSGGAITMA